MSAAATTGGTPLSVDELITQLSDANPIARTQAVELLAAKGADAVEGLGKALESGDAETRRHAAIALGRIGPPASAALPELCSAMDDHDKKLVGEVLFSISRIGVNSSGVVSGIENQLNIDDAEIRMRALDALVSAKDLGIPALQTALGHSDPATRFRAAVELAELDADSEQVLIVLLEAFRTQNVGLQSRIGQSLKRFGGRLVPYLVEMLRAEDKHVRVRAAQFLASMDPPPKEALPELIHCLNDPFMWVKLFAMSALERYGAGAIDAVPVLFRLMDDKDDKDWDIRFKAGRTISVIDSQNPALVPRLLDQLQNDTNSNVRREAAKTLGQIGANTDRFVHPLDQAMHADEGHVRLEAVRALWRLTGDSQLVLDGFRSVFETRWAHDSLEMVREMGPAAKPLVPDLLKLYKRTSGSDRRRVAEIIKSVDADLAYGEGIE